MKRSISILLIVSLCLGLCACGRERIRTPGNFYYCRQEPDYQSRDGIVAPEQREIAGIEEDLEALLAEYCKGPKDPTLYAPLPKNCRILSCSAENDVLRLDFDKNLSQLKGIDLTVAAACLTRTFLPLTGCQELVLTADGALLNGNGYIRLSLRQLDLRDDSLMRLNETCTVYYADSSRRYLIPHEISINLAETEQAGIMLLEQLLKAPPGTRAAIPINTRILSVSREDNVCLVNLSREFEQQRFSDHRAQLLSLLSIVSTLTEFYPDMQVEFAVEGQLLIRYGAVTISEPLRRDERFFGPVRTWLNEVDGTLYLVQETELALVPMATRLHRMGTQTPAEMVMAALLGDSGRNGISTWIPDDTRLLSVSTDGEHCTVDLSREYLSEPEHLELAGQVIAASLCDLSGISSVTITVEGAVPRGFDADFFENLVPSGDWFL